LITCKEFLTELNEYLDDLVDPQTKACWQEHVDACPNCFVVVDTTKKTMQVYKGMELHDVPEDISTRLWQALEKKMAANKSS
jgi:hypothetical protein